MKDQIYTGKCGHEVVFTVRDQEYFKQNGWPKPVRCRPCQRAKKQARERAEEDKQRRDSSVFKPILDEMTRNGGA